MGGSDALRNHANGADILNQFKPNVRVILYDDNINKYISNLYLKCFISEYRTCYDDDALIKRNTLIDQSR